MSNKRKKQNIPDPKSLIPPRRRHRPQRELNQNKANIDKDATTKSSKWQHRLLTCLGFRMYELANL